MTGSTTQLINGILLLTTFGCSRLIWGTYQSVLIYHDLWTAWINGYAMDNATSSMLVKPASEDAIRVGGHDVSLPLWLALLYLGSNTVLSVLNFYWFNKMIAAVRKRFQPPETANSSAKAKKRL